MIILNNYNRYNYTVVGLGQLLLISGPPISMPIN